MTEFVNKLFNVEGKVAALTGAGGHLIGALSHGLAKAGVKVAVMDLRPEKAERVSAEIKDAGGEAIAVPLDVSSKADNEKALAAVLKAYGDLDYVVLGAGTNCPTPFFELTTEEWQGVFNSQLLGTMLGAQVFGKYLVDKKRGSIVTISSASAGPPLSKVFPYSAAKAGIKNLTQNLGREWALHNVRVNAIRPGFFPTEWNRKNFISAEREAQILNHTAMRRFGDPDELVGALIWLLSDASGFVTGAEIVVDGGFSCMTI